MFSPIGKLVRKILTRRLAQYDTGLRGALTVKRSHLGRLEVLAAFLTVNSCAMSNQKGSFLVSLEALSYLIDFIDYMKM